MTDAILVLNAGSSSLKVTEFTIGADGAPAAALNLTFEELTGDARFRATDPTGRVVDERRWGEGEAPGHGGALDFLMDWLRDYDTRLAIAAIGHRVVHGGTRYQAPVRVTPEILADLDAFVPLAPLHQPHNLSPIRLIAERRPELTQIACFDTAFHRTAPELAQAFALPAAITEQGVRRYGFHGLSYAYIASVLAGQDPRAAAGRTIVLHLGNGASGCALRAGESIASTMGFTALDGLMMGTRCGDLDPGVVLYLMDELGMDARGIERLLYRESGLLGVSGVSSDMRVLLASDEPRAKLAVELFIYRIAREVGSLAAALEGLDALVFTAGIGEHAAPIRAGVCRRAAWLGIELDEEANTAGGPRLSTPASATAAWVIPTDEELMIARHCRDLLAG